MKKQVLQCMILSGLTVGGISAAETQSGSSKSLMQRLSHEKAIMQRGLTAAKKRHIQKKKLTRQELRYYNAALKRLAGLAALLAAIGIGAEVRYKRQQEAERARIEAEKLEAEHQAADRRWREERLKYAFQWGSSSEVRRYLTEDVNVDPQEAGKALMRIDDADLVQRLIAAGASVDARDIFDDTILMEAIDRGNSGKVQQLLTAGADPNLRNKNNHTTLSLAVRKGRGDIVQQLLAAGADPNLQQNVYGALIWATWNGRDDIVQQLLAAGADPNQQDEEGNTVLSYALRHMHEEIIKHLLDAGADPDVPMREEGGSKGRLYAPLLVVSINGLSGIVGQLLAAGADPNVQSEYGPSALTLAVSARDIENENRIEVVQYLLGAGADVNAANQYGDTALMLAALYDHENIVKMLLDARADKNLQNNNNQTAADLAQNDVIANMIREYVLPSGRTVKRAVTGPDKNYM